MLTFLQITWSTQQDISTNAPFPQRLCCGNAISARIPHTSNHRYSNNFPSCKHWPFPHTFPTIPSLFVPRILIFLLIFLKRKKNTYHFIFVVSLLWWYFQSLWKAEGVCGRIDDPTMPYVLTLLFIHNFNMDTMLTIKNKTITSESGTSPEPRVATSKIFPKLSDSWSTTRSLKPN